VINSFPKENEPYSPHCVYYQSEPDLSLLAPFGCCAVGYKAKRVNVVDPKWHPGSIAGVYIGGCEFLGKRGYAILGEDGVGVYYCSSAKLEMGFFPFRPDGDQRLKGCYFRPDKISAAKEDRVSQGGNDDDVTVLLPPVLATISSSHRSSHHSRIY
jgi:hypothetical protein